MFSPFVQRCSSACVSLRGRGEESEREREKERERKREKEREREREVCEGEAIYIERDSDAR